MAQGRGMWKNNKTIKNDMIIKSNIIRKTIVIGALLMIFPFSLFGCRKVPQGEIAVELSSLPADVVEGEELIGLAETREEAEKIAETYGITLVSFEYGVATFHTEEDPTAVIDRGLKAGYPELSLNGHMELY